MSENCLKLLLRTQLRSDIRHFFQQNVVQTVIFGQFGQFFLFYSSYCNIFDNVEIYILLTY